MRKIVFIFLFCVLSLSLLAQTHTRVFNEQIRTLRVERKVLLLENGVVDGMEPDNTLHISFDEMSHDVRMYTYTVQMMNCSASLNDGLMKANDGMLSSEYLWGFTTRDITDYEHSINTSREYTHYWFDFPNEDMAITKSGNYRLTIYEDGNPDNRVAEVDFCVVEPMVKIDTKVRANTDIEFNGRYQQVDVDVDFKPAGISYQPSEISVVVTQNNRQDNSVTMKQPTFVEPNRLRYINNKALIFEAGNEYHHFDAFSCFYAGYGIDRVYHEMGDYHALLFPNEITKGQYIHEFDSDGRFVCYLMDETGDAGFYEFDKVDHAFRHYVPIDRTTEKTYGALMRFFMVVSAVEAVFLIVIVIIVHKVLSYRKNPRPRRV